MTRLTGRRPKLTPDEVARARRHRDQGITTDSIAATLGVSGSTLRRYLRGENVHHRNLPT